ncbi:AMIN domain-containing protein [Campylobacter sp. MIT 21-1685]|uniref:AMIN domain-containing protein n=1 Tax=unclassified Campylobacter TaxID=2593542 RepID=UPI00224B6B52|nr:MULTISPECIES: AMIN domain-containing protein [unclassified Campylobacter]MCX2682604.1 AMIN domain-containing protein [Campylobacter sp. MIT 21-1684]MCX2750884.1 AMIN domain-containing protein [Campylobacter sp. MIT 21-1682]MCX2807183.1 AMIN domain-containing protein [Campylobacter sp. MIT 21-1685]
MKRIFLGFFIILMLYANENPFKMETKNQIVLPEIFERKTVKFNSEARILKSISFHYINLDGNEAVLNIDINKSIDWHDSYTLLRTKTPEASKIFDVSVTIPEKNSSNTESLTNIEIPTQTGKIYDFISYTTYKNKIKLSTTDEIISDFSIGNPSKIVIDFKSNQINLTKNIRLYNSLFKRINFGSHKGYYRLVIYLDGKYDYRIQKDSTGYMINLF